MRSAAAPQQMRGKPALGKLSLGVGVGAVAGAVLGGPSIGRGSGPPQKAIGVMLKKSKKPQI